MRFTFLAVTFIRTQFSTTMSGQDTVLHTLPLISPPAILHPRTTDVASTVAEHPAVALPLASILRKVRSALASTESFVARRLFDANSFNKP